MRIPKVKLKINLDELFGGSYQYGESTKEALGQAIIDKIVERTQEQRIDKFGKKLAGYSKAYANSLDGQVGGKVQGQAANLTLSGDMLSSINIIEKTAKTITIGFDDDTENAKAFGHISGMEGHPTIKKGKVRDFFGLPKSELRIIADEFKSDIEAISEVKTTKERSKFEQKILDAIKALEGENG